MIHREPYPHQPISMNTTAPALTRRSFLGRTSSGLGSGILGAAVATTATAAERRPTPASSRRLPREVRVATICQAGLNAADPGEMIRKMLTRMEELIPQQPDVICLPECFHTAHLACGRPALAESAEKAIGRFSQPIADFATKHRCNVICPIYTTEDGRYYNTAVVIDRAGKYVGEYRKINPTDDELKQGVTPGPLDPPVFKLDFGTVGVQICFDINWHENWRKLSAKGAEIVFWPSAYAGGEMLNALAWINKFYVVSSTRIQSSKMVDVLGDTITETGRFDEWLCAPLNLDVAVVQGWTYMKRIDQARAKYGRKIDVRTKHVEAWARIESLSPDISVPVLLKEFELETSHEMLARNARLQDAKRPR